MEKNESGLLGLKIIALFMSIVLWVIVLGSRDIEMSKDVPVQVSHDADLVPAHPFPDHVTFRLMGPKAFLRAILDRKETPIHIQFSNQKPGVQSYRFFSDNIRLPIGVKVVSIQPPQIQIQLDLIKKKEVQVRPVFVGNLPEGFKVAKAEVSPPMVQIKGPQTLVDSMGEISTTPIDLNSLRASEGISLSLELDPQVLSVEPRNPKLALTILAQSALYRLSSVNLTIKSDLQAVSVDRRVSIYVRSDAKRMQKLKASDVKAVLDLSGRGPGRYFEAIQVIAPQGIQVIRVVPEKLAVVLERKL